MRTIFVSSAVAAGVTAAAFLVGGTQEATGPQPPVVVAMAAAISDSHNIVHVFRTWSDGRLDRLDFFPSGPCEMTTPCVLIPGACEVADIDRDGVVGINDFLGVIEAWGPFVP